MAVVTKRSIIRSEIIRMRNIIIVSFILFAKITIAQQIPSFELTKTGIAPVIITVDSLSTSELYKMTLSWVYEYYKDQKKALKTDVENQKIQVEGIKKNAWFYAGSDVTTHYDVEYVLYIDFDENKMILTFELGKTWNQGPEKVANSYFIDYRKIWKENGEVHKIYKEAKPGIDHMTNEISEALVNYLREFYENANINKNEKGRIFSKTKF